MGNDVTVMDDLRFRVALSLCVASNPTGINQLTQQCNLFEFLLVFYFSMNQIHQIVHLLDMIAKFPETGITSKYSSPKAMSTFCVCVNLITPRKQVECG